MNSSIGLTRNQTLVLDALAKSDAPLSAYSLLDQLRGNGLKAPPQIYRALEKLISQGRVHRLESINAFMACQHKDCQSHAKTIFMICEKCGKVSEKFDAAIYSELRILAACNGFLVASSTIELRGTCATC
jgi:Fur family zinc uptake transcriptional regulator